MPSMHAQLPQLGARSLHYDWYPRLQSPRAGQHRPRAAAPHSTQLACAVQQQQHQLQHQQSLHEETAGTQWQRQQHSSCEPHALSTPKHASPHGELHHSTRLHGSAEQQQQRQQQRRRRRQQLLRQQRFTSQLQLLSEGAGQEQQRPQPEPPSTSAAPSKDGGSSSSSGGGGSSGSSSSGSSNSSSSSSGSSSSSSDKPVKDSVDDEVDAALEKLWANIKQDLKKELPPDQASMLDRWSPSDISTDKVFREMANHQLGPFLQSMGIEEDPYDFFLDLFRLALVFQLVAAGLVFYTVELGLGGDVGDAFRAVGGLFLGYTLRLVIKVEQLAWPIYNGLVQLLISEGATYEIPPASAEEQRDTLNRLGVALAVAFLVPKFAFGFGNEECWQIVVPMLGGLFFFDVAYMLGLLIKLSMGGSGEDDDS